MHRWDRRDFERHESLQSLQSLQSLCRCAPVTAATAHSGDMIGYGINICITESHSMCVVREGLWISKFQEVWEVSSKFDIGFKLVRKCYEFRVASLQLRPRSLSHLDIPRAWCRGLTKTLPKPRITHITHVVAWGLRKISGQFFFLAIYWEKK